MNEGKWSISTNGETYFGEFTMEEAIEEASTYGFPCWVGKCVPPIQPEELFTEWTLMDWLDNYVREHDDYAGEWAEGSVNPNNVQLKELAAEIRPIIAAWLDRHDLRPTFFNIIDPDSVRKIED